MINVKHLVRFVLAEFARDSERERETETKRLNKAYEMVAMIER